MWLLAGSCAAESAEPADNRLRVSGFGTLGVVHTSAPPGWGFLRSLDQTSSSSSSGYEVDSRLGVQANYALTPQVELVGQLVAARRESNVPTSDAVEWAFAAYRPSADLTLRAGRLNLDQFVMSDYRNVGFAYLYARPPVEFYGSIPTKLDGVDVARTWFVDDVRWRAKGFVGNSRISRFSLTNAFGASISREADGLLLRAGFTRASFAGNVDSITTVIDSLAPIRALPIPSVVAEANAIVKNLDLAAQPLTYATFGLSYTQALWQYAAELTRVSVGNSKVTAGYASVGRRFDDVTVFGLVSGSGSDQPVLPTPAWGAMLAPVVGPALAQQAQWLGAASAELASRSARQSTWSIGARWDVHPRMAIKVQWDHVRIRANGDFLWFNATSSPGSANVATVLLDFVF